MNSTNNFVWDSVSERLRISVYNSVYNSVHDFVSNSVYNSVCDSVGLSLGITVWDYVRNSVKLKLQEYEFSK
jgi:hypothetical protein